MYAAPKTFINKKKVRHFKIKKVYIRRKINHPYSSLKGCSTTKIHNEEFSILENTLYRSAHYSASRLSTLFWYNSCSRFYYCRRGARKI